MQQELVDAPEQQKSWFGHPAGLSTLFFTEMWERLSYYGMRSLLVLYMVAPLEKGGLGFSTGKAGMIYGAYTGLVYAAGLPGGLIADKLIGQHRAVLVGAIIIALGHFALVFSALPFFFGGLALIILGTGLLKPNISALVGSLYAPGDRRRDSGFSLFYLGINLGSFLAPLAAGTLGQRYGWHWGFGTAGVGMVFGIVQYILGKHRLAPAIAQLARHRREEEAEKREGKTRKGFTRLEWQRLGVVGVLFIFASLFWAAFEQAGSTLNLFADRFTRLHAFGWEIPSTWFQSLNPIFIIIFAPLFSWLWVALGNREPSSPMKFVMGLWLVSFGFLLLVPASAVVQNAEVQVSPWWLVGAYLLHTLGELCLSPVSLSMVTKLAPERLAGGMMGFWFLTYAAGNALGGWIAGFFESIPLTRLFGSVFLMTFVAGCVLLLLVPRLKRMMGGVQ